MDTDLLIEIIRNLPSDKRKSIEDLVVVLSYKENTISNGKGFGALRGQIWMSEDFNEPIKAFHDYSYTIDLKFVEKIESLPVNLQKEIEASVDEMLARIQN